MNDPWKVQEWVGRYLLENLISLDQLIRLKKINGFLKQLKKFKISIIFKH